MKKVLFLDWSSSSSALKIAVIEALEITAKNLFYEKDSFFR